MAVQYNFSSFWALLEYDLPANALLNSTLLNLTERRWQLMENLDVIEAELISINETTLSSVQMQSLITEQQVKFLAILVVLNPVLY